VQKTIITGRSHCWRPGSATRVLNYHAIAGAELSAVAQRVS